MEEIFKIKESSIVPESIARSWYKKSHNHYEPSEQVTREYVCNMCDIIIL